MARKRQANAPDEQPAAAADKQPAPADEPQGPMAVVHHLATSISLVLEGINGLRKDIANLKRLSRQATTSRKTLHASPVKRASARKRASTRKKASSRR